jgi:hypothetical protein
VVLNRLLSQVAAEVRGASEILSIEALEAEIVRDFHNTHHNHAFSTSSLIASSDTPIDEAL